MKISSLRVVAVLSWATVAVMSGCGQVPCEALAPDECGTRVDCSMNVLAGFSDRAAPPTCHPLPPPECGALDETECSARADCQVEQLACIALCVDDGHGGCQPCPQQTRCIVRPPPRPAACSTLDVATCRTRTDCVVSSAQPDSNFGAPCFCDPAQGGTCDCRVTPVEHCIDAPPPECETLDVASCGARTDCHVAPGLCDCIDCACAFERCVTGPVPCTQLDVNTCSTRRDCRVEYGGGMEPQGDCPEIGGCQRPAPPAGWCVDAGPVECWQLDAMTCSTRADCELNEVTACPACLPGEACPPCTSTLVCDVRQTTNSCTGLDVATCSARTDCQVEEVTACPSCLPGTQCPPCESRFLCVDRPVVDACTGLGVDACRVRPDCMLEEVGVCPACAPGANCPPCSTSQVCVSRPPVDTCSGLDVVECAAHSECSVEEVTACPACLPGQSCPPCTTEFFCAPIGQTNICYGLDPVSCEANPTCELDAWACTADCRDDGDGGCLPCEAPAPSCRPASDVPAPAPLDGGVRGP